MKLINKASLASLISIASIASLGITSGSLAAEDYLIKNATLHTATARGTLVKADVYIKDGKIDQVGREINIAAIATLIDGTGKSITPGLINAATNLGLVEISAVESTVDASSGEAGVGAAFQIAPAINFRSTLIPQNRINGLTRAIVWPSPDKSIYAGIGASIILRSSLAGMINENIGQIAVYGEEGAAVAGGSRASAFALLEQALIDANYLRKNENRYLPGFEWHFSQPIADLKALYPVLDGKSPLVMSAHRADDIIRLLALAKKHSLKLVIEGGGEAWMVAKELAAAKVPVILDPMQNLPSFEGLAVRLDGAALLDKAGVKLMFTGGGSHNAYLVRQSAGNAVAYGLPKEVAIEAMSINTAEVFGIKNYGQLKVGMDADIVLWDGDPLDVTSSAEMVFIQGENQPMVSRATRLADRYWKLKGNHQQAYQQ